MTWPWSDDVIRPLYVLTYVEPYRPFALIFAGNECFSCTQRTAEGKDFELILTLKMETRHPAAVSFRHCNHCRVMTVWPELARPGIFRSNFYFFEKNDPLWENFHSSVSIVFTASGSTLLCWNVVKFSGREMAEIVRYLQDKKTKFRLPLKLSLLRKSRPKSAKASPNIWLTNHNVPNFIEIGSLSAEL